ncbi:helix-turn-helix domain-containing protein [Pseudonocardia sp.]|jgi:hypothetical protein|uniref:PucR family transcriptional regulator n=1 Tax=Pseudonocardia sp. TaxID=60912 RepID=UPI0031FC3FFA
MPTSACPSAVPAAGDRRENLLLRELVAVYSHLSGLASQDSDVDGVVRLVAHRTGSAVAVLGPTVEVLAAAPTDAGERLADPAVSASLGPVLAAAAQNRRPVSLPGLGAAAGPIVVAPILVGDEVAAHLVTLPPVEPRSGEQELDDDLNLLLTEHAATICGIILGRERVVAAAAGQARTDLIEGLLLARDRDDGEAERWAGHLGFVPGCEHHVLTVRLLEGGGAGTPASDDTAHVLALAEHAISRRLPGAIVAVRDTEVVAVVAAPPGRGGGLDGVRSLAEGCRAAVLDRHPDAAVVAGVGGCCRTAGEISRSYSEARSAVDAARRMGRAPAVLAFDDLGVHRLLLQVPDLGELRAFAADVLGELVRDREHRANLVGTLSEWFRCNGSPQRTARELHVHPNTVSYRIRRVEEIAGLRLDHYRDRLMAQLACEIMQVLGDVP